MNIEKPELLVPAGDFNSIVAGVQNGADAVYFGNSLFSARASAKNFDIDEMQKAIKYCKLRNVKTHLTLNTLLLNSEFNDAIDIARDAYEAGIDAIIVQDLGLAKYLINNFKNLSVHGSTQMSIHNLEGVLELQKLGFERVVLSRELNIEEINYIRRNSDIELEVFIHGALCISYSGQCLFSSMVGGRSGNRGKCAQPCRLPYDLVDEDDNLIDSGYLLSPKDLESLEYIPNLIESGVNSFKIEGRLKSPEYVGTVTRIYRKYIDLACSDKPYVIDEKDKKDLLQVFNRGGSSNGHLDPEGNHSLIYKEKGNNIGLPLGEIHNFNKNHGYITVKLLDDIGIGDGIAIDGETGTYTVSELMINGENVKEAEKGTIVKLGRMKGNIKNGRQIYKISSKKMLKDLEPTLDIEKANFKRVPIDCNVEIKKGKPITVKLGSKNNPPFYEKISIKYVSELIPEKATNSPITEDRIIKQFSKLGNTPYCLNSIDIDMENDVFIPSISELNEVRRTAIEMLQDKVFEKCNEKVHERNDLINTNKNLRIPIIKRKDEKAISVLLDLINPEYDYEELDDAIDNLYIPLRLFLKPDCEKIIKKLSKKFSIYIYMPTVMKGNYRNIFLNSTLKVIEDFKIQGFVVSNLGEIALLESIVKSLEEYELVANYTLNIFNNHTSKELEELGITTITPSVELPEKDLNDFIANESLYTEICIYGRTKVMHTGYCPLGSTNKCRPDCDMKCQNKQKYYLKDRLGFKFRIVPNNLQTVTSIYNSKITSLNPNLFKANSYRINILDENIEEINKIVETIKNGECFNGKDFTSGNLYREI